MSDSAARRGNPVLELQQVSCGYPDRPLVSGLDVSLHSGDTLAIVGPSGSGKTTLLDCLVGLADPSQGKILISSVNLSTLREGRRRALRRHSIGLVRQKPDLLDEITVAENVCITSLLDGVDRARALQSAVDSLRLFGLEDWRDRSVSTLSGGEAQRVAVARALCRPNLALIVADEPTAALDRANANLVTAHLVTAAKARGAAVVLATHDSEVSQRCDETIDLRAL